MKIKALELNNFRGFEKLNIQFPDNNLAVFIGTNGSGKSSVLDALGMFFSQVIYRLTGKSIRKNDLSSNFVISENDIRIDSEGGSICRLGVLSKGQKWVWAIFKSKNDKSSSGYDGKNDLSKLIKNLKLDSEKSLPVFVYYQNNRIILKSFLYSSNRSESYIHRSGLIPKISQFNDFLGWFKRTEHSERISQVEYENYKNEDLEAVRIALTKFSSNLTQDQYSNLHVRSFNGKKESFSDTDFAFIVNKNGQDFDINQLSDGEKTLIMLVCDIARRLTIANPALENKLEGEGVVMIDEIELHLHPAWQRNVLPALQATFPNIQFVVTTHSPQVLSGVERESVFVLKDFQLSEHKPYTKGRDSNSILKEVQGVDERPKEYREKLDKLAKLLDDEKSKEVEALLDELKKDFGERDVEITRIETIMHFFDD